MDEIVKQLLIQAPFAAIFLWQLRLVYSDLKLAQTEAAKERGFLINEILELRKCAQSIEIATTGLAQSATANKKDLE